MPPLRTLAPLAALALLAVPPAHAQTRKRSRVVSEGMTPAQVTAQLGPPARVRVEGGDTYLYFAPTCRGCREDVVVIRECRVVDATLGGNQRYYVRTTAGVVPTDPPPPHECVVEGGRPGLIHPPDRPRDADPPGAMPANPPRLVPPPGQPAPSPAPPPPAPPPSEQGSTPDTTPLRPSGVDSSGVLSADAPRLAPPPSEISAAEWRRRLRLDVAREGIVALPAASISSPTAFGLGLAQAYVGLGYQVRTRYTEEDDAAAVLGVGLGDPHRWVGVDVTLWSYSTIRGGGPLETGGIGVKLHRAVGRNTAVAVGAENLASWGGSDAGHSFFGVATHVFRRTAEPGAYFNAFVVSLGAGNGRFRSEGAVFRDEETVNVFGSVSAQVIEPVALVADWTGQDLYAAVSLRPLRRVPLIVNVGLADVTGEAGDGARVIVSAAYGVQLPLFPFR